MTNNLIARLLYGRASDMDFADYVETQEETIEAITEELDRCPIVKQMLDIILSEN